MNIGNLDLETTKKVLRLFIASLTFLCITTIMGLTLRAAHQLFFSLSIIILFALIVRNIWLTLFMWWSCLLFVMFKFEVGQIYITNIFYGAILYFLTKYAFEKKHIDFFIKIYLWLVVINLSYGIVQLLNLDFIYNMSENCKFSSVWTMPSGSQFATPSPNGFMGNSGITATLYCLAIPLIATRGRKSFLIACMMLIPIFILRSFTSMICGVSLLMFLAWFRFNKKIWFVILAILIGLSVIYLMYFDLPGVERFQIWKEAMKDGNAHPMLGWGMDSFRKITSSKNFDYRWLSNQSQKWDNPHNLLVSLFYEFGIISILLLIGYLRQTYIRFKRSIKTQNLIALSGFVLGFFIISMGSFPIFVCRLAVLIIPMLALYEVETNG